MNFALTFNLAVLSVEYWAAVPFWFWAIVFFTFGAVVGSFLNVCIYRLPIGLSIVSPPSHCPHCKYSIPWYLNIPLVTWVVLRGKCANCKAPISARYFVVELMTAILFILCWFCVGHGEPWLVPFYCLIAGGLIVASFIDLEHFIIPDGITIGGIVLGFICSAVCPLLHWTDSSKFALQDSMIGIAVGAGLLYIISRLGKLVFGKYTLEIKGDDKLFLGEDGIVYENEKIQYEEIFYRSSDTVRISAVTAEISLKNGENFNVENKTIYLSPRSLQFDDQVIDPVQVKNVEILPKKITLPREVLGMGDVKLMAAVGAFLGWKAVLFTLFASSLIGSVAGICLILLRKQELSSRIPYGPYIALGTYLWMIGGYYYLTLWFQDVLYPLLH